MEYFDIVLFSPPSRMINHYRPPLALLYVGGYLSRKGLRVKIIDTPMKEQVRNEAFFEKIDDTLSNIHQQMIAEFKKIKTKIVGITCYTPEYYEVIGLARDIKKNDPSVTIIAGGVHPSFYPHEFFDEDTGIDICVLGDGEVVTYELCQKILSGCEADLQKVGGIVYRDCVSGKIIQTQDRHMVGNLDEISFPDYGLIDMDYYTTANPYAIRGCYLRSMYLLSTRGCPSQCTFCVAKSLRKFNSGGRKRSAEGLIRELRKLKEDYRIDSFYFIDDLFTIDKNNVKRFCELLRQEHLGLLWGCSSKVTTLNEDVLRMMADAGCVQIDFGVERGSDAALREIKKGIDIGTVKNIFALCHRFGIRTFANMLVNLPGETEQDLQDILRLVDEIRPEIVSLNIFTPYPGTEIYERLPYKFRKEEYADLSKSQTYLLKTFPEKFRFSSLPFDIEDWTGRSMKQYNRILPNLFFHLSPRYLKTLLASKAKGDYVRQFGSLVKELINQKF